MCVDPASGRLLAGNRDMEAPEFIEALIRVAADVGTKVESHDALMRKSPRNQITSSESNHEMRWRLCKEP